jgi:single-stranded DNA-binding protein
MSRSVNKIILIGNVGRDPEIQRPRAARRSLTSHSPQTAGSPPTAIRKTVPIGTG